MFSNRYSVEVLDYNDTVLREWTFSSLAAAEWKYDRVFVSRTLKQVVDTQRNRVIHSSYCIDDKSPL